MSVLSQMIRDREPFESEAFWSLVKTPSASHQKLRQQDRIKVHSLLHGAAALVLPVPIADGRHLPSDQAGKQRPHPGARQELFKQPSEPNVDVVRMFVHVPYLLGDPAVSNNRIQIAQRLDALQSAEVSPGVVP